MKLNFKNSQFKLISAFVLSSFVLLITSIAVVASVNLTQSRKEVLIVTGDTKIGKTLSVEGDTTLGSASLKSTNLNGNIDLKQVNAIKYPELTTDVISTSMNEFLDDTSQCTPPYCGGNNFDKEIPTHKWGNDNVMMLITMTFKWIFQQKMVELSRSALSQNTGINLHDLELNFYFTSENNSVYKVRVYRGLLVISQSQTTTQGIRFRVDPNPGLNGIFLTKLWGMGDADFEKYLKNEPVNDIPQQLMFFRLS